MTAIEHFSARTEAGLDKVDEGLGIEDHAICVRVAGHENAPPPGRPFDLGGLVFSEAEIVRPHFDARSGMLRPVEDTARAALVQVTGDRVVSIVVGFVL